MSDRFKFRVYAPIQEVYADVESIDYIKGLVITVCGETFKIENIKLLQSTGLKDKNGKLIFEGDIIKEILTDFINEEIITVVKWDKLNATYNLENFQNCEREVIGNIYQNKSLLESGV